MPWLVEFHNKLAEELARLPRAVRVALAAHAKLLEDQGPALGRPAVDTLKGSRIKNLKELRFDADGGVWRVAFAFDDRRVAILLVAGDKKGQDEKRFYRRLISEAERRWKE